MPTQDRDPSPDAPCGLTNPSHASPSGKLERAAGILALALAAAVAFLVVTPSASRTPVELLAFPLLVWAALHFGGRGAAIVTLGAGAAALTATLAGRGPFVHGSLVERALLTCSYIAALAVGALLLVAAGRSRGRTEERLRNAREQLERRTAEGAKVLGTTVERLESETTARKRAEAALLRSQRLSAGSPLSGGIAHQLNNPLAAILMAGTYALDCTGDPRERDIRRETLEEIVEQAERCGRIIRSLLQLARDEDIEMWVEDLNAIVGRACESSRDRASGLSATITCELCDDDVRILANPVQLEQALLNLLNNAITSREGGAHVKVTVTRDGNWIRVGVLDDGEGIPAEHLEQVFEPHFSMRKVEEGCGLGLSLARDIVSEHHGRLGIESVVGTGTHAVVELPAHLADECGDARDSHDEDPEKNKRLIDVA